MSNEVDQVERLFFVGDSTVSYGIGTDSAALSTLLYYLSTASLPLMMDYDRDYK